jgi:hypothetical protein
MSENKHHIDDIFKKGLSGLESIPPVEVWEKSIHGWKAGKEKPLHSILSELLLQWL